MLVRRRRAHARTVARTNGGIVRDCEIRRVNGDVANVAWVRM